jgi:hypothetical protein
LALWPGRGHPSHPFQNRAAELRTQFSRAAVMFWHSSRRGVKFQLPMFLSVCRVAEAWAEAALRALRRINTMKTKMTLWLAAALVAQAAHSFAGEFANGSFESPGITITNAGIVFSQTPLAPVVGCLLTAQGTVTLVTNNATVFTGWRMSGPGFLAWLNGRSGRQQFDPVDGTHQLNFNGGNTQTGAIISQTFDTTVGQTYVVTFHVGRVGIAAGEASLTASVTSGSGSNLAVLKVIVPATEGYGPATTLTFVATTPDTTLSFADTSLTTCDVDVSLDNVSVVSQSIQPSLDIALHTGLRMQGRVGRLYRIEFSTEADTNAWATLTTLALSRSPFTFFDPTPATQSKRFYRTVELP